MVVTNIVLETQPGRAHAVADLVGHLKGVEQLTVDGDHRVLATWSFPSDTTPSRKGCPRCSAR